MPVRAPPAGSTATKYITMSLRKVSEQALWTIWFSSPKNWGISKSEQKESCNTIKFCDKEFKALMIQEPGSPVYRAVGSWSSFSAGDGKWLQTSHRPLLSEESHLILQRKCKNTSGWFSLHRLCLFSGSACSAASLVWW